MQDLKERQEKQKHHFDRGTRERLSLAVGDTVRVQMGREWAPAIVTEQHEAPRLYVVTTETWHKYRRNSGVINKSREPPPEILPPAEAVGSETETTTTRASSHQTSSAPSVRRQMTTATPRRPRQARSEPEVVPSFPPDPVHMPDASPRQSTGGADNLSTPVRASNRVRMKPHWQRSGDYVSC